MLERPQIACKTFLYRQSHSTRTWHSSREQQDRLILASPGRCQVRRQSANWEGLDGCAPCQAPHMVLNILFDAHAASMRSAFGAQTRCSSRPLRQRAVRVSAAAVQQQPPRSFKLAAAVCQMWQSHQQQTTSSTEQVSIHLGRLNTRSLENTALDGPLCACH